MQHQSPVQDISAATCMALSLPTTPDVIPSGDAFDSWVRIKVGESAESDEDVFEIHRNLLKFYSGYFQVAVRSMEEGHFAEGVVKVITLSDEDVKIFKLFKTWLYTRTLPMACTGDSAGHELGKLIKLWCFGDRRNIPLLQNECVNSLVAGMESCNIVPTDRVQYIYEHTLPDSPLRNLIICASTQLKPKSFSGESADRWTKDSLLDVAKILLRGEKPTSWKQMKSRLCEWHVHDEGVSCKK